jgi:hypothetical protein
VAGRPAPHDEPECREAWGTSSPSAGLLACAPPQCEGPSDTTQTRRRATMMPAARVLSGSSLTRRIAATVLAACGLVLLGAAPGWANGRIAWHGCGPEQPPNLQCGELSVPLDYSDPLYAPGARYGAAERRSAPAGSHECSGVTDAREGPSQRHAGSAAALRRQTPGTPTLWQRCLHNRSRLGCPQPSRTGTSGHGRDRD